MARKPIMIMGCTSDAGKSLLVTALCRRFASRGLSVAPFKAQNMSNNAAVTPDGLEIGRAQYVQALAARVAPEARMNPILLKPSSETHSQVVVMGRYDPVITDMPWLSRKPHLWPVVRDAMFGLLSDFDQLVIEGAGSPAETNLRDSDLVNMRVALACEADVYLAVDIDRGGAFAHLLGTFMCLSQEEQALIKGFVLNKFRGDPKLLGNAMDTLQARTGVPTVAIVPFVRHALPEEDALHHTARHDARATNIALLAYPYASNLEEFDPLIHSPLVNVVPIRDFEPLSDYAAVLLPGSKNTVASLQHLRATGLDAEIARAASDARPVLGVCGGMQLLGHRISDPEGLEGGDMQGLGLLDLETTLAPQKTTTARQGLTSSGQPVLGYEIHHGVTRPGPRAEVHLQDGLGYSQGCVTGVYLHGLLENANYRRDFLGALGIREGGGDEHWSARVDQEIDRVAELLEAADWQI